MTNHPRTLTLSNFLPTSNLQLLRRQRVAVLSNKPVASPAQNSQICRLLTIAVRLLKLHPKGTNSMDKLFVKPGWVEMEDHLHRSWSTRTTPPLLAVPHPLCPPPLTIPPKLHKNLPLSLAPTTSPSPPPPPTPSLHLVASKTRRVLIISL